MKAIYGPSGLILALALVCAACSYDLESLRGAGPVDAAAGAAGSSAAAGAGGGSEAGPDGGAAEDAPDTTVLGGNAGVGGSGGMAGSHVMGGAGGHETMGGAGGQLMTGGAGGNQGCVAKPEDCNDVDDDCNGLIDDGAPCPPSAVHDGHIYFFGTQLMSWLAARAWCHSLGRDAVILNEKAEHEWFAQQASDRARTCRWLGLTDIVNENQWVWINGTPAEFFFWGPEQPNDNAPGGEDCVALIPLAYLNKPSTWSDLPCEGAEPVTQCLAACEGVLR